MRRFAFPLGVLLFAACTAHAEVESAVELEDPPMPEPAKKGAKQQRPRAQKPAAQPDERSSYALAADVSAALSEPSLTRAQAVETVRADWQGKRYQWEVGVSAPLCRLGACNVFPFDHATADDRIVAGWLPRLNLSADVHADLLERCGPGLCVATVEATLKTFVFSPEEPTSLTFSDVAVLDVRPRREKESWVRRKADPRMARLRTRDAGR
ncbi:MAG: hypothetical protein ACRBN8_25540 [Nannocystales bacterium]